MATENMMKRYHEEPKETIWEIDLYDQLYQGAWDGNKGIYKSQDGKYFYAEYHGNALSYNENDYLVIIPESVAKEAVTKKYWDAFAEEEKIDPEYYLIECNYIH